MSNPKAFVSYSWDDAPHKERVATLATELRGDGIETMLDQWHAIPGDQLPAFMEKEIRENDYVLITCTPNYKLKTDERKGGVGYEGDIMTAEVHTQGNHRKFIPILAKGS
ncbi:toll/interleukin-1 receptor domain-containing protein [Verrucomicrobiales bacterium]|nr:toll/interleukin-1 receptor domain-containing protein [Verrucomicrobiales bacterium]